MATTYELKAEVAVFKFYSKTDGAFKLTTAFAMQPRVTQIIADKMDDALIELARKLKVKVSDFKLEGPYVKVTKICVLPDGRELTEKEMELFEKCELEAWVCEYGYIALRHRLNEFLFTKGQW